MESQNGICFVGAMRFQLLLLRNVVFLLIRNHTSDEVRQRCQVGLNCCWDGRRFQQADEFLQVDRVLRGEEEIENLVLVVVRDDASKPSLLFHNISRERAWLRNTREKQEEQIACGGFRRRVAEGLQRCEQLLIRVVIQVIPLEEVLQRSIHLLFVQERLDFLCGFLGGFLGGFASGFIGDFAGRFTRDFLNSFTSNSINSFHWHILLGRLRRTINVRNRFFSRILSF